MFGLCLDVVNDSAYGLVDTAFEVEGVGTCGHVLQTFSQDGLCQYGSSGGTVTGIIGSFAGHATNELCTGVLESVFEVDFLGHADTVLGDAGGAEFLLDDYIAAFGTEGYLYGIGEGIGSGMELFACLNVIFDDFCHDCLWIEYPLLLYVYGYGDVKVVCQNFRMRLSDDGEHVLLVHDEILFAFKFNFGSGVFSVEDIVAGLELHLFVLGAVSYGENRAFEGFFLSGVGDDDSADGLFFCRSGLDDDAVCKWSKFHRFVI